MADLARLSKVRYAYPHATRAVLQDVDWEIPAGSVTLVVGKSGTGKSTLLRCLNGLVPHFTGGRFAGDVVVNGLNTRDYGPRHLASTVGFVFQDPESQMVMDRVDREIAIGMEHAGVPQTTLRKRVEEALDLLGIANLRDRDPATLSGGERQRVAIASVMAMHPALLVLDEPTSQLDPWGGEEVVSALARFSEDLGMTVVLSEHRLDRVLAHADRVRLIDDSGEIVDGGPREIARRINSVALPPVATLGRQLGWDPLPLTVKETRQHPAFGLTTRRLHRVAPVLSPRSTGSPVLALDAGRVQQGGRVILSDVSLTVRQGELVALMGRNGSGKTTLLRSLMGFHPIERGSIRFSGRTVANADPVDRQGEIGYVPQQPLAMFSHSRLRDDIAAVATHRRGGIDVDHMLELVDLSGMADRHPSDLSVGQRQRAAIALVLASEPRLMLLDEPTRGMDPWHKRQLSAVLDRVRAQGIGVLMATHDVELVAEAADRVVLLGNGSVVADDVPERVLTDSLSYSTQINRVFGGHWLTVGQIVNALHGQSEPSASAEASSARP